MINQGRCSSVRQAITEKACLEQRAFRARICEGCPGPSGQDAAPEIESSVVSSDPSDQSEKSEPVGFWVDCTGHEDLLERFTAAVADKGLHPGESALDLIYLFDAGLLVLRGKV